MNDVWKQTLEKTLQIVKKYSNHPNTFCLSPYTYLDFDQSGEMHSCYAGTDNLGNWKTNSIIEEFNNDRYKNLRMYQQTGQQDKSYSNCKSCYKHEQMNNRSARQKELVNAYFNLGKEKFENLIKKIVDNRYHGDIKDNIQVEMRASNFCNLQCMHCDHNSSTQWLNFFTDQENIEIASKLGIIDDEIYDSKNIADEFKKYRTSNVKYLPELQQLMSYTKTLNFSGGEPLLDPNHEMFLNYLIQDADRCKIQNLWYHTNLNVKDVHKFFYYWQHFKSVHMIVSIDCPPSTYKFFRRNGSFDIVRNNIQTILENFSSEHIKIECRITFNFFAALRWLEITDYWIENNFVLHSSLVNQGPVCAEYLPTKLKDQAIKQMEAGIEKVKNHPTYSVEKKQHYEFAWLYCYTYLKNSADYGDKLHEDTQLYLNMMDKKTDLQTLDFYPELERYYNKTND